jgi:hypothetical protein
MVDLMVGHGPAPDFGPYVPDYVIVQAGHGIRHVFSRDGRLDISDKTLKVTECAPEPMAAGCWPLVFGDLDLKLSLKVEWFPTSDEKTWRPVRAQRLLASAQSLKGDPELSLRTIRAAAALVAVDIEKMARDTPAWGETPDRPYGSRKR